MQPIDPNRLHSLRKAKNLSRARLALMSNVSERTIQRLENPKHGSTTPHEVTTDRLARALKVEPHALSAPLLSRESAQVPAEDSERVQIGALVSPKARLAYDLAKRRYGVSASEIINMAPLFFVILAEGSLARRRQKLGEAYDALDRLAGLSRETGNRIFNHAAIVGEDAYDMEARSIDKADLFGDLLLFPDVRGSLPYEPFDPDTDNPFVSFLRTLTNDLERPGVVEVERNDLTYGSPAKFPDYDICGDDLDGMANGSSDARVALETGHARISAIPDELMAEDAADKRATWLEERLPDIYRNLNEDAPMAGMARFEATTTPGDKARREALMEEIADLDFGSGEEGEGQ